MDRNKNYYIYMIKFEDGRFYIGCRQSKVPAAEDTKYWGSPVSYKHLWEDASLSKTKHILKVCDSEEQMDELEPQYIKDAWNKYPNLCLNRNAAPAFPHEIAKKAAPLGGKKSKELGLGIHAMTIEEKILNGKRCAKLGLGIHSEKYKNSPETKEKKRQNGKRLGKYTAENGLGVHSEEFKLTRRSEISKKVARKIIRLGKGIHDPDLQKYRKEWSSLGGRTSYKKFKFISPEGIVHEGMNYNKWCKDMGLKPQGFSEIINGRQKTTQGGWRLADAIPLSVFDLGD